MSIQDALAAEQTSVPDIPGLLLASIYAALDGRDQWIEALHNICDYIGTTYAAVLTLQFAPEPKLLRYLI